MNFNSKLVRLNESSSVPEELESETFKFQTGTIERGKVAAVFPGVIKYQFQPGTIERADDAA